MRRSDEVDNESICSGDGQTKILAQTQTALVGGAIWCPLMGIVSCVEPEIQWMHLLTALWALECMRVRNEIEL